jgi:hypothetical protein
MSNVRPLMSPVFSLLVDGTPQPSSLFALPEMSLSSSRSRMTRRVFILTFKAAAVVEYLEPTYASLVIEYERDDELCGEPQDELAKAGYPSLSQVLASPPLRELVIGGYLFRDLFGSQTWDGRDPNYWFDEVTSCTVNGDEIKIAGVCHTQF